MHRIYAGSMQQWRQVTSLIIALAVPLVFGGQVSAAGQSIAQELQVTATVPHHRDIIVDSTGNILEITSNTPEDVEPKVYFESVSDTNRRPLTPELYKQYREFVPEGTAKYGVLYQRTILMLGAKPTGIPLFLKAES